MSGPITFTLDLEDHRPDEQAPLRYPTVTRQLLERLAERKIVGSFYVVGVVAEAEPDLVREVAAAGHEIGLHGWRHVPLTDLDPETLRRDAARGKALLEDLTGTEVVGFRAPTYSLTARSVWATDVLAELGFTYSSSVLPGRNPLYGFPGVPEDPFRWPSGLAEFPVPIAGVGPLRAPYLGGTYLRCLPGPLIRRFDEAADRRVPWTYLHPYDLDTEERFWVVPDAGWMSPLLWVGRRGVLDKLDRLDANGPPLRDRLHEADAGGTFDPAALVRAATSTAASNSNSNSNSNTSPNPLGEAVPVAGPLPTDTQPGDHDPSAPDHTVRLHTLPKAPLVDRVEHLVELARGRRVVHIGFVDAGFRETQDRAGTWLHAHLATVAANLVGLDVDEQGVEHAVAEGYEAYEVDCRDADAIAALGLQPADLVIAGEVIEHLDDPGGFLAGIQALVGPGGELVITTPNAYGLFNVLASLTRHEINHPDHVVMFTWQTLTNMAARHGWSPIATNVYVPAMKEGPSGRMLELAGRAAVGLERLLARLGRSYAADGLIVRFRSTR